MEKEIKSVFSAKWWNPLFWLKVVCAPLAGIVVGFVGGAVCGLLVGYEKGLDTACRSMNKLTAQLP